ncbi:MAG: KOW domain-containing RNA-binding protein [Oscillospiraceae bacterium]|nr:KOW domain-containing RNA-binding protein [Oscillospiraceae bacterium]
MDLERGDLVYSLAGHDRGRLFCVLEAGEGFLLLANGRQRKLETPKRKRRAHVRPAGRSEHPVFLRLRAGESVGNQELRGALAAFQWECEQHQGGTDTVGKG